MPILDSADWFSDADLLRSEGNFQAAGLICHRQLTGHPDDPTALAFPKNLEPTVRSWLALSHATKN